MTAKTLLRNLMRRLERRSACPQRQNGSLLPVVARRVRAMCLVVAMMRGMLLAIVLIPIENTMTVPIPSSRKPPMNSAFTTCLVMSTNGAQTGLASIAKRHKPIHKALPVVKSMSIVVAAGGIMVSLAESHGETLM